jgi:hypothetical protein
LIFIKIHPIVNQTLSVSFSGHDAVRNNRERNHALWQLLLFKRLSNPAVEEVEPPGTGTECMQIANRSDSIERIFQRKV